MTECPECGLLHPPTPGGCPVAKTTKRATTEKGRAINKIIKTVSDHLESTDDWKDKIKKINRAIGGI